jgi:hypothetical protein
MTSIDKIGSSRGRDGLTSLPRVTAPLMRLEGIGDINTGRGQPTLPRNRREATAIGRLIRLRGTGRGGR